MSDEKLIVTKSKLDALATSIATKAGVASPLTIAQMKVAVDNLVCGTVTQDENGYLVISENGTAGDLVERFTMDEIVQDRTFASGDVVYTGTNVYPSAFANCPLTSFTGENVQTFNTASDNVGERVFANCQNLTSVYLPNLTNTGSGGYQFYNCTKLTDIYMPLATTGQHMFEGCTSLVNIVFAQNRETAGRMNSYGFNKCSKLKKADIGNVSEFSTYEFYNCSIIDTIILRRTDAITALTNINAFNNSPFASGKAGGTLYVPSALISDYQSATNWSTILGYANNSIASIEGSIYETQYADGTLISS